jgi:hypothetical protein
MLGLARDWLGTAGGPSVRPETVVDPQGFRHVRGTR